MKLPRTMPRPGGGSATPGSSIAAPVIEEPSDIESFPTLVLIGGSGSGKTHGLARIVASGLNCVVVAVEPKMQQLGKYKPLRINISAPIDGRPPTHLEKYDRLMAFKSAVMVGGYREHAGKKIDCILIDGAMEVGNVIHRAMKEKWSRQKALIMWEEVGIWTLDFFEGLRDAAGLAAASYGFDPIPIVITCGEELTDPQSGGLGRYIPLLPGKKAGKIFNYMFEVVWRMEAGTDSEGDRQFRVHTVGSEEFYAKSPVGLFENVVVGKGIGVDGSDGPDVGVMFKKLLASYKSE